MTNISNHIDELIHYALLHGLLESEDTVYAVNRLVDLLEFDDYVQADISIKNMTEPSTI